MKQSLRKLALIIAFATPLIYLRFPILGLPTNLIEVLIIVLFVLTILSKSFKPLPNSLLSIAILLMVLGVAIAVTVSPDMVKALGILKGWFIVPIFYGWSAFQLFDNENYHDLPTAFFVSAVGVGLYGCLQYFGLLPLLAHQLDGGNLNQYVLQGRAIGFYESPNYLAMYLVPLILLSVMDLRPSWSRWKFLLIIPVIAVILTQSQAGWIALAIGLLIIILRRYSWSVALWASLVVILLSGVVGYLITSPEELSTRFYIWRESVALINESPFMGIGPGQFQEVLTSKVGQDLTYRQLIQPYALHAHNLYLNFWLSAGITGLIGFLLLTYRTLKEALSQPIAQMAGPVAALSAILVHGLLDTTYFKNDLAIVFWAIIALIWLSTRNKEENA